MVCWFKPVFFVLTQLFHTKSYDAQKKIKWLDNLSAYDSVFQPFSSRGTFQKFLMIWRNLKASNSTIYSVFREPSKELAEPLGSAKPRLKNTGVWYSFAFLECYNINDCLVFTYKTKGIHFSRYSFANLVTTVKPVYNDHSRDPEFMAVVDRWSLFKGNFMLQNQNFDSKMVVIESWSLFRGGR